VSEALTPETLKIAEKAAKRIAKKCWSVPAEDLHQEAITVVMTAAKNYDPEKGPLAGYLYRAATRHLINYVYDNGSPVNYKHRRAHLAEVRSTEITEALPLVSDTDVLADAERTSWREAVVARVSILAGDDAAVVVAVLINESQPVEVSRATGVPLLRILGAVGRVREAMADDTALMTLWSEAP
jgi:DNA-directed RNA polymerase specialized sigma24 family protein